VIHIWILGVIGSHWLLWEGFRASAAVVATQAPDLNSWVSGDQRVVEHRLLAELAANVPTQDLTGGIVADPPCRRDGVALPFVVGVDLLFFHWEGYELMHISRRICSYPGYISTVFKANNWANDTNVCHTLAKYLQGVSTVVVSVE